MRTASILSALAVSLMMVGNLWAAEDKTPEKTKHPHPKAEGKDIIPADIVSGLNLTADQKAQLDAIKTEYAPKVKEAQKKIDDVLTADQKTARKEAAKASREAAKKNIDAALKLTDEQKGKIETAKKENKALRKEIREKIMNLLTQDQKDQLKKNREHHKAHKSNDK